MSISCQVFDGISPDPMEFTVEVSPVTTASQFMATFGPGARVFSSRDGHTNPVGLNELQDVLKEAAEGRGCDEVLRIIGVLAHPVMVPQMHHQIHTPLPQLGSHCQYPQFEERWQAHLPYQPMMSPLGPMSPLMMPAMEGMNAMGGFSFMPPHGMYPMPPHPFHPRPFHPMMAPMPSPVPPTSFAAPAAPRPPSSGMDHVVPAPEEAETRMGTTEKDAVPPCVAVDVGGRMVEFRGKSLHEIKCEIARLTGIPLEEQELGLEEPRGVTVVCDRCERAIVHGEQRFKCASCADYDLCGTCHTAHVELPFHLPRHTFVAVGAGGEVADRPEDLYVPEPPCVAEATSEGTSATERIVMQAGEAGAVVERVLASGMGMKHAATCDHCHEMIVGVRYKCVQCADYDLCERCEERNGERVFHDGAHFFAKLRKQIPAGVHFSGTRAIAGAMEMEAPDAVGVHEGTEAEEAREARLQRLEEQFRALRKQVREVRRARR